MASFIGTAADDVITPDQVSAGVTRDPPGSRPSQANDQVSAAGGDDRVETGGGSDFADGQDGRDTLDGGGENDVLRGGADNDLLIGGSGNDDLGGGDGNDTYLFDRNWGQDFVNAAATIGRDVIEFTDDVDPDGLKFRIENDDLIITQGDNSIFLNNQYISGVGANALIRTIEFGDGSTLDISQVDPDWLIRNGTNVGEGITGSIFRDTIDGKGGNDNIFGGNDNDILTGGADNDFVAGGTGNDTYRFDGNFGIDTLSEGFNAGADVVEFLGSTRADDLTIFVQGTSLIIQRGANQITLQSQFASGEGANALFEKLRFAAGPDIDIRRVIDDWLTRTGRSDAERFDGSIFRDTLDGAGGNDTILGDAGNDSLTGNKGDDFQAGGLGDDVYRFDAQWGVDFISEGFNAGKDTIAFGPGITLADLNFRVENTNLIVSDGGSSITIGSQFSSGTGANALFERILFNNGDTLSLTKPLDDWLDLTGTSAAENFGGSIFDDTIAAGGGNDNVSGGGAGRDDLDGGTGDDTVSGGVDNDLLRGGTGNDFLFGGDDKDTIRGDEGNDSMRGDAGDDSILGGTGADTIDAGTGRSTIDGGTGNDSMTGGDLGDTFVFRQGDGADIITNFAAGRDELRFIDFGAKFDTAAELLNAADQVGDSVVFDLQAGGDRLIKITLINVDVDDLSADNFLF